MVMAKISQSPVCAWPVFGRLNRSFAMKLGFKHSATLWGKKSQHNIEWCKNGKWFTWKQDLPSYVVN